VLNMDMIGSLNTPSPTVLLEGAELSQWMIDGLAGAAATYTTLEIQTSLNPFASDHVPFLDASIPAVLTIEGADSANDAIHTGNDTIDRIDMAFAMEILRMNLGFVATEAGLALPTEAGCGCGGGHAGADAATAEQARVLSGHFHALFAQYARLSRDGLMNTNDYTEWLRTRAIHDSIMAQAGLPATTDH
ncbi:MAG TPA: M28 family peptidase, partial [Chromatiales bacterium]|nr:M28 family peptidase [Chromatiales bacterium]